MTPTLSSLLLRSVALRRAFPWPDRFPYNVPVLASLEQLEFTAPVTFLVGENGSGKSTLLEALACAAGSISAGSEEVGRDETLKELRTLAKDMRLTWSKRTRRGFFMRSEAPLSPVRQLSFLVMLQSMIEQNSQFIIATHSPILMAFPGAVILSCDDGALRPIPYEEVEHVAITRTFLQDPRRYLRHLGLLDET